VTLGHARDGEIRMTDAGARGEFATFWRGDLNPFAYACLASFPRAGVDLIVYGYERGLELPPGVRREDARQVCSDETLLERYQVDGKPSIATFADLFRYRMIRETGCCWVDTDLICLERPFFAGRDYIFCRQADAVSSKLINNAVLRLPPSEPALAELVARAEAAADVDQTWGALGPFLLTPILEKHRLYDKALEPRVCYPIEPEQFWRPFAPAYKSEVEEALQGAAMLHLWSEAITWSGYDRSVCPPAGSYLHSKFHALGVHDRFDRVADESEVLRIMSRQIAESGGRRQEKT